MAVQLSASGQEEFGHVRDGAWGFPAGGTGIIEGSKARQKRRREAWRAGGNGKLKGLLLKTLDCILKETADRFPTRRNMLRCVF